MRGFCKCIGLIGFLVGFSYSSPCAADGDGAWGGAGWYQIETDRYLGAAAIAGPFETTAECEAKLHPSDDEATRVCTYLATKAEFDNV
jgi:hypothetical protein